MKSSTMRYKNECSPTPRYPTAFHHFCSLSCSQVFTAKSSSPFTFPKAKIVPSINHFWSPSTVATIIQHISHQSLNMGNMAQVGLIGRSAWRRRMLRSNSRKSIRNHTLNVLHPIRLERSHKFFLLHLREAAAEITRVHVPVLRRVRVRLHINVMALKAGGEWICGIGGIERRVRVSILRLEGCGGCICHLRLRRSGRPTGYREVWHEGW
jgi:hypothetical protein